MGRPDEAPRGLYMLREWREGNMPIILGIAEREDGTSVMLDLEYVWFGEDDVDLVSSYRVRTDTRVSLDDPGVLQDLIAKGKLVRIGNAPSW